MKVVVAALRPTPILWWRASGLASPTEVPASTLPALRMAPVRANMASRSVVLPLWKGPTSAMHRGPRGLLTSCPIAASSFGARPVIGSADLMLRPRVRFGKSENVAALHRDACALNCFPSRTGRSFSPARANGAEKLTSRPQFQALQSGGEADADQHVAADADAERGAALRTGVRAAEIARPEPRHRRVDAPGQRGFLGNTEIEAH